MIHIEFLIYGIRMIPPPVREFPELVRKIDQIGIDCDCMCVYREKSETIRRNPP